MEFVGITEKETFFLVGMDFFGDPFGKATAWSEENRIGELWRRFYRFYNANPGLIRNIRFPGCTFEAHFITPETIETGFFDVFAGVIASRLEGIPLECVARQLPETNYAVFTLKGSEIISDWDRDILKKWPDPEYEISHRYSLTCYDKRFKGMDQIGESEIDVYVPVKRKSN